MRKTRNIFMWKWQKIHRLFSEMIIISSKKVVEYDILRVIVTVLVILGHCSYYRISTNWGGVDYTSYSDNIDIVYKLYREFVSLIYSFHMPLFISLSGALFHNSLSEGKYKTLNTLIITKAKRLLIPYFAVLTLYSFPLKWISGYFHNGKPLIADFLIGQVALQGNNYLWFLLTLFFIFILFYLMLKAEISRSAIVIICLAVNFIGCLIGVQLIQYICNYMIWFAIGYYFNEVRLKLNQKLTGPMCLLFFLGLFTFFLANKIFRPGRFLILKFIMNLVLAFFGCAAVYALAYLLKDSKIAHTRCFRTVSRDSFGLYLYSDPVNYLFLACSTSLFGPAMFSDNGCTVFLIGIRILLNFAAGFALTEILRKFGAKYVI